MRMCWLKRTWHKFRGSLGPNVDSTKGPGNGKEALAENGPSSIRRAKADDCSNTEARGSIAWVRWQRARFPSSQGLWSRRGGGHLSHSYTTKDKIAIVNFGNRDHVFYYPFPSLSTHHKTTQNEQQRGKTFLKWHRNAAITLNCNL